MENNNAEWIEVQDKITPEVKLTLKSLEGLIKNVEEIEVRDEESAAEATNIDGALKDIRRGLEGKRKEWTIGLVEAKRNIDSWFKRFTCKIDMAEPLLNAKLRNYIREKQMNADEEAREKQRIIDEMLVQQKKAEERNAKKEGREPEEIKPIVIEPEKIVIKTGAGKSFSVRKVWTFEVVDKTKVPLDLLEVNTVKINSLIRGEGIRELPGLRIFQEDEGVMK